MLWHLQSYTYLFLCALPKISTDWEKNWHQYVWKLAPIYLQYAPIYSKIGSNIFAIYAFFHLCHTNLQVMTPGVEDRVQTLSLGLEAPPFEGVFWLSSLTSTINYWIAILKKTQHIRSGLPRARAPQVRAARQSSSSRPSSSDPPSARNKLGRSRPSSITGLPRWLKEIVLH